MIFVLFAMLASAAFAQTAGFAALRLPDSLARWFGPESTLIEMPARPVTALDIEVRQPAAAAGPGAIAVHVNGKGIGNILTRRASEQGVILSMSPAALANRPDAIFDPEENIIEVSVKAPGGRLHYQNWIVRSGTTQRNAYFTYTGRISAREPAGVPPDILLEAPVMPPVLKAGEKGQVRIKGSASAGVPGIDVQIDGQPLVAEPRKLSAHFDETVAISSDKQQVVISATDSRGHQSSVTIPVVRRSPPARRVRVAGNRHAVLIGISRFGPPGGVAGILPPVSGAAAAAERFASTLEKNGFARSNIRVLADEEGTVDQMRSVLADLSRTGPGDFVLVFVATRANTDPREPNEPFLAGYGTREGQWRSTGLALREFETLLNENIRAGQAVMVMDIASGGARNVVNNRALHFFDDQEGRAVLVSSMADQNTDSDLFAAQLMKSFSAGADLNGDAILTADETLRSLVTNVRTLSKGAQTPRFRISSGGSAPAISLPEYRAK